MNWADELSPNIPIQLLHGDADIRVTVNNSIEFAKVIARNNTPHKLVVYPDDNHGLTQNKMEADKELVSWFKRYL